MNPARVAARIAALDVAHLLRARETLVWTFVMPIVFFYFFGTVTGGMGPRRGGEPDPLALVAPAGSGFLVDEIERRLAGQAFRVERVDEAAAAAADRRLIVPPPPPPHATVTAAALAGERVLLRFERRGEGPGVDFDRLRVARAVYQVAADLAITATEPGGPGPAAFARLAAEPRALTLEVAPAGRRRVPPRGLEQTIPGTLVMFTMLVLLTSGAISLVVERQRGLLRRLASTPLPRGAVVGAKWSGRLALGLVQIAFGVAAGSLLFDLDWGGSLAMVGVVLLAWAAFAASLALLLAGLARTEAQATGVGVFATMVLAALGGCWWPIEIAPRWMQTIARFLPSGWTMDALHRLVSFGDGPASALPHAAALLAAAVLTGWAAARRFRFV